jgi:hypothetical protein
MFTNLADGHCRTYGVAIKLSFWSIRDGEESGGGELQHEGIAGNRGDISPHPSLLVNATSPREGFIKTTLPRYFVRPTNSVGYV